MPTPEQHFERFRRNADATALAAVFDALAPELLLIAAHLLPAGAEAEDLVQATFLDAIEKAARWDGERPLLPWLIGILVNHARLERRRLRRTLDTARLEQGLGLRAAPAPFDALAAGEVAEQVAQALRGLPRQYRQALTLRLVHGLTPTEIAHSLGCPVPTVKTRLQRGMEWLRQALPAGIATTIAVVLTPGRGLAAVREVVVAQAGGVALAAASAGWISSVGGGLLMKKVTVVGVVALCATTLWFVAPHLVPPPGTTPIDAMGPALVQQGDAGGGIPASPTPSAASAGTGAPADQRVALTAPSHGPGSARIEFVWKDDGTPAAGLRLQVSRLPSPRRDGRSTTAQGIRHASDAQGVLSLSGLEPGTWSIRGQEFLRTIEVRAEHETRECIEVVPSTRVRGIVVDAEGRPVGAATVWRRFLSDPDETTPHRLATTGDDGRFDGAADRAVIAVWAARPGHAPSRYHEVASGRTDELRLVLGHAGCGLRGVVHAADGRPAEGALVTIVRASHADARYAPLSLTTDASGRFATDELDAGEHMLLAQAREHAPALVYFTAAPGERTLEVQLERGATVYGTVRDAGGVGVSCVVEARPVASAAGTGVGPASGVGAGVEPRPLYSLRTTSSVCRADGGYRFEHLPAGGILLRTFARNRAIEERVLELRAGEERLCDIVLAGGGVIRGRVVDQAGAPLGGWTVWSSGANSGRRVETSGDGRFELRDLADAGHAVAARPEEGVLRLPWALAIGVRPGGGELELRAPALAAGGQLVARLLDREGRPAALVTLIVHPVGDPRGLASTTSVPTPDGRLALGPLPPGTYRLRVGIADDGYVDAGTHVLPPAGTVDLGLLRSPAAGTLVVRLRAPGGGIVEPAELSVYDGAGNGGAVTERASDGSRRTPALAEGVYSVRAWGETFQRLEQEVVVVAERETPIELEVTPAATVRFAFPRPVASGQGEVPDQRWLARAVLTVRDAAGGVVAGHMLAIDTADTFLWSRGLAPGRYDYEATPWPDGAAVRGSFVVPAGSLAGQRVEVRLPAATVSGR